MAVRFKFRSSVNFDSVGIGEQPFISVRDLKSKILRQINLNICHDFDLVFSDALTGQEYMDEDFQIPDGSCVIMKRVPVGTTHTDMVPLVSFKDFQSQPTKIGNSSPVNVDMNELDDFGADLYSVLGATTSPCDLDIDLRIQGDKTRIDNDRFSEPFKGECHKVEDLSGAIAAGPPDTGKERNASETKTKPKTEDFTKLEKVFQAIPPSLQKIDLPPELKCSVCDSFLKDAMMIPCCQHSFCERCIRLWLVKKGACPKCYSSKCTVGDLLPNVSLRQAIVHFLESYITTTGSHNAFLQYAPDGGSEAHSKGVSYNVPTHQKETDLPHSPSPTETGSNEIIGETGHDLLFRENASLGCIGSHFTHFGAKPCKRQILKERHASACPEEMGGFNSNLGKCKHNNEEVESIRKEKRGPKVNAAAAAGDKRLMYAMGQKMGNITCYMCGSPDHLVRGCPATFSLYYMQQRGICMLPRPMPYSISPYWNATSFYHYEPFNSLHENHGVMPFKMVVFPSGSCAFPFMPSMCGSVPSFSDHTKINGVASPLGANRDSQASGSEFLDIQNHDNSQKLPSDGVRRVNNDDDCNKRPLYKQTESSHRKKSYLFREKSVSAIHERCPQWQKRKHGCHNLVDDEIVSVDERNDHSSNGSRGQWSCRHPEQSSSEVEDFCCSSCCCSEGRNKQHHRGSKREIERDNLGVETDCVQGHRFYKVSRKRDAPYIDSSHCKQYGHSESDLKTSFSPDEIREQKLTAHDSRFSKHRVKSVDDDLVHNRWQMISGSDDSDEEDCRYHKWKKAR